MQRLVKVYGQARYPEERIQMIYERVGFVEVEVMKKQISYFIGAMEKAPMLNDFIEGLGSVLVEAKNLAIEEKIKHMDACVICNGTGHNTMYDKNNGWDYAFQCTCPRGALLQPSFAKQYPGMESKYASHRAWAANRFDRISAIKNGRKLNAS